MLSQGLYSSNPSNELLLLVSPSYLISLLIYTLCGKWNLGLKEGDIFTVTKIHPLVLNDGLGLEWWHILGLTAFIIIIGFLLLLFKIKRLTADEI